MKNPAKPATIGAFVIGAAVLAVVGVLLFGSGKWFRDTAACVMHFDGDVQGLNVGAPVKFRGVKIGVVTSIATRLDRETLEVSIPVYADLVDLDEQLYGRAAQGESVDPVKALVDRGLRAQLQSESLVTGQLFVQLDFYPDAPAVSGPLFDAESGRHEIPTLPTTLQKAQTTLRQVLEKLEKLPIEKMLEALQGALVGADKVLSSPDLLRAPTEFVRTLEDIRQVVSQTGEKLDPLIANAGSALASIDRVARDLQPLVASAAATVETIDQFAQKDAARLVGEFEQAAREARAALVQTRQTLSSFEQMTLPTSATGHQLRETLTELAAAARAVRHLADALERQPNAVFVGKHREAVE